MIAQLLIQKRDIFWAEFVLWEAPSAELSKYFASKQIHPWPLTVFQQFAYTEKQNMHWLKDELP